MKNWLTELEPGLLRTYRLFTALEVVFYLMVVLYFWLFGSSLYSQTQYFYYLNLAGAVVLLGYLSWPWMRRQLKSAYLPLALTLSTGLPIISNRIFMDVSPATSFTASMVNAWQWMPMLFVPLVIIAWQYDLFAVSLYCLVTGYFDISLVVTFAGRFSFQLVPIISISIIRTSSFLVVGYIVTRLMKTQREQRAELLYANLQLSQHAATVQQLAVSRERNRLARELHDTLAHTLSGLVVHLEAMKTTLECPGETDDMLGEALSVARDGLTETRRALKDLRATQLDDLGLELALQNLISSFATRTQLKVETSLVGMMNSLNPEEEQGVYRIVQEALENIARHAQARCVSISALQEKGSLVVIVSDDGGGFDVKKVSREDRFGLRGMYEWAEMIGASLAIDSQPGKGTRLELRLEQRE